MTSPSGERAAAGSTDARGRAGRRGRAAAQPRAESTAPSRKLGLALVLLSLLGVALSIELTRIHVFTHTDPRYHSVCALSEGVNCETVALSPTSVFAGLPVSVWGIVGYLVMGAFALCATSRRRFHATWPLGILLTLAVSFVAVSAVLAFLSVTRIDSLCIFCLGSYAVNVGLLIVSVIAWRQSGASALGLLGSDAKALLARPGLAIALAVTGVVVVGGLLGLVPSYWRAPGWTDLPELPSGTDRSGHHWIGARVPRLTIVEFSDYQCPHCRAAHQEIRALAARHPSRIRLVHRHLPLDMACHPAVRRPFHSHACAFAEAAECAGLQGRFWPMNDALFSMQESRPAREVDPVELAVRLGLNRPDFERCLDGHATAERIAGDVREAMSRDLTGTPSFLVGDRLFVGGIPPEELERLLSAAP